MVATSLLAPLPVMAQSPGSNDGPAASSRAANDGVQQHLALISRYLPEGKTLATARTSELVEAVRQAILANPNQAVEIAGAIATVTTDAQINAIADAIGKLFRTHPALRAQAVEIAIAMAEGINSRNLSLEAAARSVGEVSSTLISHLDPSQQASLDLVRGLVKGVIVINPHVDYTQTVLEIVLRTIGSMGFPDDYLGTLYADLRDVIQNPAILQQIDALFAQLNGNNVHLQQPGMVIAPESDTMNF